MRMTIVSTGEHELFVAMQNSISDPVPRRPAFVKRSFLHDISFTHRDETAHALPNVLHFPFSRVQAPPSAVDE